MPQFVIMMLMPYEARDLDQARLQGSEMFSHLDTSHVVVVEPTIDELPHPQQIAGVREILP